IHAIDVYSPTTAPGDEILLIATDAGVFRCIDPRGTTTWSEVGANLPNALVFDLHYVPQDDVLVAGTLGRGAWVLPNASAAMGVHTLAIVSTSLFVLGSD